jgi:hypothetical protein
LVLFNFTPTVCLLVQDQTVLDLWPDSESGLLDLVYVDYLLGHSFRWLNLGHADNLLEPTF